jgi:hypothetical protein
MSIDTEDEELFGNGVGWYVRPYVLRSRWDAPTRLLPTIKPSDGSENDGGAMPAPGRRDDRGDGRTPSPRLRNEEVKK